MRNSRRETRNNGTTATAAADSSVSPLLEYSTNIRLYNENIRQYIETYRANSDLYHLNNRIYQTGYSENVRLYNENMYRYQDNITNILNDVRVRQQTRAQETETTPPNVTTNELPPTTTHTQTLNPTTAVTPATRPRYINELNPNRTYATLYYDAYFLPTTREAANTLANLQNVIVRPTEREIALATRTVRYSANDETMNSRCPISLEDFQHNEIVTQIKHCNHTFRETSFNEWFGSNVRCPVCRYDIREYSRTDTREPVVDLSGVDLPDVVDSDDTESIENMETQPALNTSYAANRNETINQIADFLINSLSQTITNEFPNVRIDNSGTDLFEFSFQRGSL